MLPLQGLFQSVDHIHHRSIEDRSARTPVAWSATASGLGLEYQFFRLDAGTWNLVQPYGSGSGGIAPLQHKFWVFDGVARSVGQDWSAANTWTWTPTTGSYYVQVWVRNAGSSAAYDGWLGSGPYLARGRPLSKKAS